MAIRRRTRVRGIGGRRSRREFLGSAAAVGMFAALGRPSLAQGFGPRGNRDEVRPRLIWLGVSGVTQPAAAFDATMRRSLLTQQTEVLVLNGPQAGYADLVAAIKSEFPNLKVLRYTNAQRVPDGDDVAATMWDHFNEPYPLQNEVLRVLRPDGTSRPRIANGRVWVDITSASARSFIATHLQQQVAASGTSGVAIDTFHTQLDEPEIYVYGQVKAAGWLRACSLLLQEVRAALPPGALIWFNGLWPDVIEPLEAQSQLLKDADGAAVEFYGGDGSGQGTSNRFADYVAPINALLDSPMASGVKRHQELTPLRL